MARDYDQIRAANPLAEVDGDETFTVQKDGVTSGGSVQILKNFALKEHTAQGKALVAAVDQTSARTVIDAQKTLALVTQVAAEEGTATTMTGWSALRVHQAAKAQGDAAYAKKNKGARVVAADDVTQSDDVYKLIVFDSLTSLEYTITEEVSDGLLAGDTIRFVNTGESDAVITPGDNVLFWNGTTTPIVVPALSSGSLVYVGTKIWLVEKI